MPTLDLYWMDHANLLHSTRTVTVRPRATRARAVWLDSLASVAAFVQAPLS